NDVPRSIIGTAPLDGFDVGAGVVLHSDSEHRTHTGKGDADALVNRTGTTVHGLVTAQVRRTPQAIAVIAGDTALTYAELDDRADRLARALRRRGVVPDTLVAVCLERGIDLVVALLGILKAGGAYVPLDPAYPAARL